MGDSLVFDIERRAAELAGLNHSSRVEDFQLACYGPNELYGLHRDDDPSGAANRAATVLIYLRAPERGGATLFTGLELEKEIDPQTKKPLRTEKAAVALFRDYCQKPRRKHTTVEAVQGRGVVWKNWYGTNNETAFAATSTHGACPVERGEKCVIQQWISRTAASNPLRDGRIAAIFTAGADFSFGRDALSLPCLQDVSVAQSDLQLCCENKKLIHDGPFSNVGGARLSDSSGLMTTLESLQDLTVSFWVRNILPGTTILSLSNFLTVRLNERNEVRLTSGESVADLSLPDTENGWMWFSVSAHRGKTADVIIYSKGNLVKTASLELEENVVCNENSNGPVELVLLKPPAKRDNGDLHAMTAKEERSAFVQHEEDDNKSHMSTEEKTAFVTRSTTEVQQPSDPHADVSFIVLHTSVFDHDERLALRHEAKRYNIDL